MEKGQAPKDGEIEQLIEKNRGLVFSVLRKQFPDYQHDEDYIQIGTIGLWKAIASYDESKCPFTKYACLLIRREILREIQSSNCQKRTYTTVPLSEEIAYTDFEELQLSKAHIELILTEIEQKNPRLAYILQQRLTDRTLGEISKELGITRERVRQLSLRIRRFLK